MTFLEVFLGVKTSCLDFNMLLVHFRKALLTRPTILHQLHTFPSQRAQATLQHTQRRSLRHLSTLTKKEKENCASKGAFHYQGRLHLCCFEVASTSPLADCKRRLHVNI